MNGSAEIHSNAIELKAAMLGPPQRGEGGGRRRRRRSREREAEESDNNNDLEISLPFLGDAGAHKSVSFCRRPSVIAKERALCSICGPSKIRFAGSFIELGRINANNSFAPKRASSFMDGQVAGAPRRARGGLRGLQAARGRCAAPSPSRHLQRAAAKAGPTANGK